MTSKDFILLFIPIVCNGLFIFIFQKIFSNVIEKNNKRQTVKNDIEYEFFKRIINLKNSIRIDLNYALTYNQNFSDKANLYVANARELIFYFEDYHLILSTYKKEMEIITCTFEDFCNVGRNVQSHHNGIVDKDSAIILSNDLNLLYKTTYELSDKYLKKINTN